MKTDPEYVERRRRYDKKRRGLKPGRNRTKSEHKDYFLKWKYGIGLDVYEKMLVAQGGVCLICKEKETRKNKHTGTCRLHVDHCHKTGKVRGLLCQRCNFGIGNFREDSGIMLEAIKYLAANDLAS